MNPPLEARRPFAMPADFHRLGLKRGECRSDAIRDATQSAVHRLADSSTEQSLDVVDRQLGQLATSAYRLLDPRYRLQLYERIQLSYALAREELVEPIFENDALLTVPDEAIDFESNIVTPETTGEVSDAGESIGRAREVVRWIRHSEENQRRFRPKWPERIFVSVKAWLDNRTD